MPPAKEQAEVLIRLFGNALSSLEDDHRSRVDFGLHDHSETMNSYSGQAYATLLTKLIPRRQTLDRTGKLRSHDPKLTELRGKKI